MHSKNPSSDTVPTSSALLTVKQAAALLAISTRSLWTLTNSGQIRSVRIGRCVRFVESDLWAFVASRRIGGT